ncbi:sensor histidine kinase, partial [Actinacidiphila rubida]
MSVTVRSPGSDPARPARPARLRMVLAWCGVGLYPLILFEAMPRVDFIVLDATVAVLLTIPVLALLRRHPWPAFGLLLFGWLTAVVVEQGRYGMVGLQVLVVDIAVALITIDRSRRASLATVTVAVPVQLACLLAYVHGNAVLPAVGSTVLAGIVAWMAGNSVRERRQHTAALATQATEQAVTAERLRIARELHDMVAHSIGVIAIQAGAGSRVIDTQPHEARNALSAIETTSRETLAGLRRMLGALRAADPDTAARPAPLDPAPGLADVQRLVKAALD